MTASILFTSFAKQRCWAHLLREIHDLRLAHPRNQALGAWAAAVHTLYTDALAIRQPDERARLRAMRGFEDRLLTICQPFLPDQQAPHRAHWQPVEYNALHGGMERWFAPMEPATVARPVWRQLLAALTGVCNAVFSPDAPVPWFIEAHQFRIDTTDGAPIWTGRVLAGNLEKISASAARPRTTGHPCEQPPTTPIRHGHARPGFFRSK